MTKSTLANKKINQLSRELIIKKLDILRNATTMILDKEGNGKIINCPQTTSKYYKHLENRLKALTIN